MADDIDPELDPDDDEDWLEPEDLTDEELAGYPPTAEVVATWRRQQRERRERWRRLPDEPPPEQPEVCPDGVGAVVRAIRWRTDTSQRELAAAADVPLSSVTRLEAEGGSDVRLSTLVKIVGVAGLRLAVVDDEGTQLTIPYSQGRFHDSADRLLPSHRPVYNPRGRYWWGFGLLQQPYPGRPVPARVYRGREQGPRGVPRSE